MLTGILLIVLSAAAGALSHVCGKKALDGVLPTPAFLVVRAATGVAGAALILTVHCLRHGPPVLSPEGWGLAVLVGLSHPVLSNACYFSGLKRGDLSVMAPMNHTAPLFTALFGAFLLHEAPTPGSLAGLVLILAGAVVVPLTCMGASGLRGHPGTALTSALLGVASAVAMALYYVFGKQALKAIEPLVVVMVLNLIGFSGFAFAAGVGYARERGDRRRWVPSWRAARHAMASGILAYVVCCALGLIAMAYVTASLTSALVSIAVVFSMIFSIAFLGERPSGKRWVGALLVVAGCIVTAVAHER